MNLIVDIGNSFCKLAVMSDGEILEIFRTSEVTIPFVEEIVDKYVGLRKVVLSSVRSPDENFEKYLNQRFDYFLKVTHDTPIPIKNNYSTPQTLGIDRLMSAVGGVTAFPNRELLIFDFGSAITIDNISAEGEFLGGNISLGMNMRFKALHTFTAKLPLCTTDGTFSAMGKSTDEAVRGGVIFGIIKEIEGYINHYLLKNSEIVIIFTGGDANYFVFKVKNTIFVDCDMLLKGLNKVLEYNYDKN